MNSLILNKLADIRNELNDSRDVISEVIPTDTDNFISTFNYSLALLSQYHKPEVYLKVLDDLCSDLKKSHKDFFVRKMNKTDK